ncbi:MAG: hypothetical protein D6681_03265 [Calditrichaeota bacterium]|nr:MAG: hypothetical protein D6681_03265 [Calditrichota bacterium]
MLHHQQLTQKVTAFAGKLRNTWQIIFLPAAGLYGLSLFHFFQVRPSLRIISPAMYRNLDMLSFVVAIGLTLVIFHFKRKYFSPRFSRRYVEARLKHHPDITSEDLLQEILNTLKGKMTLVWVLGLLVVLDGVVFYWSTFSHFQMHIYFIVGAFSLLINYPRRDLFADIPLYVIEGQRDFRRQGKYDA